jgi:hypothetical protein
VATSGLSSQEGRVWIHGTRGSVGAHLGREVRSEAVGHVVAPEPTSAGRCGPKLQLAWQCVDARPAPYLKLELVYGSIRSSECRQCAGDIFDMTTTRMTTKQKKTHP